MMILYVIYSSLNNLIDLPISTYLGYQTENHLGLSMQEVLDPIQVFKSQHALCHKNQWYSPASFFAMHHRTDLHPKYIIINLGMSKNFGDIDFEHLTFPNRMRVDYIRVYQDMHNVNIGCDPKNFPTAAYIRR